MFNNLFGGYKDPAKAAMPYYNQIPEKTQQYMQPYFNAGGEALENQQQQYNQLSNNPGERLNEIGQGYNQSPGFNFAMQQALQGANHAAAAGGMAGSPQHQQQNMQMASDIANQDYNHWMGNALNLYGTGLSGNQGISHMGQNAGQNLSDMISQVLAQQGNLAYTGQQNKNQNNAFNMSNIGKAIGAVSAFTPYSGIGSAIGQYLGS